VKSAGHNERGFDFRAGHFGRDHVGRRQIDAAHHFLRHRGHGEKTKAERCTSKRTFHGQLLRHVF